MLYIDNSNTNPYYNLACEEYILKNFTDECFMLWRNKSCIVVGKNQNTLSEINFDFIKEHSIPVVRRLSGGGAVFHDLGNLNFTFISNNCSEDFNNFRKFTQPIINALKELSIDAEFSGRNDLTIGDKKFSGNAQYHYKNRVLHHGTLLFSSKIEDLSPALKSKSLKFQDKSVKSVISRITNISSHLKTPMTIENFQSFLMNYVTKNDISKCYYKFTNEDIKNITELMNNKYATWEWNFGNSPKYNYKNEKRFSCGTIECSLLVDKGLIKDIKFQGDFLGKLDVSAIENLLNGARHNEADVRKCLSSLTISNYFSNLTVDELITCMF